MYKLIIMPCLEKSAKEITFEFSTKKEMEAAHNSCATLLIALSDEYKVMSDYSNAFIQEVFIDGEWLEIEEGEEYSILDDPEFKADCEADQIEYEG